MPKQIDEIIEHLQGIKDSLIQTVQSSENTFDLSSKLIDLVKKDPENTDIYQLIVLVNSNLETDHKSFRGIMLTVVNDIISSKMTLLRKVRDMEEQLGKIEAIKPNKGVKIPYVGVLELKDLWMFLISIFMIVLISNIINPEATQKTIDQLTNVTTSTTKK